MEQNKSVCAVEASEGNLHFVTALYLIFGVFTLNSASTISTHTQREPPDAPHTHCFLWGNTESYQKYDEGKINGELFANKAWRYREAC